MSPLSFAAALSRPRSSSPVIRHRCEFGTTFCLAAIAVMTAGLCRADEVALTRQHVATTLNACVDCHGGPGAEAGLDMAPLVKQWESDELQTADIDRWVAIYDRVNAGEMPPDGGLADEDKALFAAATRPRIEVLDRRIVASQGRARWRRMNRDEYQNAMRDLLAAPWLPLANMLPVDGTLHGYNKVGEALDVSHVNLARYMQAADFALRAVIAKATTPPKSISKRFYAREQGGFNRRVHFNPFNRSPERATFPLIDYTADVAVLDDPEHPFTVGANDPEKREREAFGVVASSYEPIEIRFTSFLAPASGRYILRFKGYTFWAAGEEKRWWRPDRHNTSKGRRSEPVAIYSRLPPRQLRRLGDFDFQVKPSVQELNVSLLEGESIQPDAVRLFRSRPPGWHNPLAEEDGMPGVAFQWMEVEGPIVDQWPTAGHCLLFDDLRIVETDSGAEVVSESPQVDSRRLIRRFLREVFRSASAEVIQASVERCVTVYQEALKRGMSFQDAMIAAYTAALCSPEFLCIKETAGKLDQDEALNRVSLFLANEPYSRKPPEQMPAQPSKDSESVAKAAQKLASSLLDSRKSDRFIAAFLDYWLNLRSINDTSPDELLYPDYYLDDWLVDSALEETRLFFRTLIDEDLPVHNLVDASFMHVNERLAKHYGIDGFEGTNFEKISVPDGSVRGGLLTQCSVLKVTANGSTTSPVVRGAWVNEQILGVHIPPPPPSVPAIEPDTRGATTIREQLARHRADASCNTCHKIIDPAGFALEAFDVAGGYRERYRVLVDTTADENSTSESKQESDQNSEKLVRKTEKANGYGKNGQPFIFHWGPVVDASGVLPSGESFDGILELKKQLAKDDRQLARNLLRQLITYSTGAAPRFSDRTEMEAMLDRLEPEGFPVKSLILELVQSGIFLQK